ncbi:hypothetical protein [Streptomyces smaragdinus]|nr:hypothetical protein [Streptomyces smaragdinus]
MPERTCRAGTPRASPDLEKKTGWKYSTVATNITKLWGFADSHQT